MFRVKSFMAHVTFLAEHFCAWCTTFFYTTDELDDLNQEYWTLAFFCLQELCVFVFVGAIICLLDGYVTIGGLTAESCGASRVALSIGPACMYSGLLTKTIRIVIIFQSKNVLKKHVSTYRLVDWLLLLFIFLHACMDNLNNKFCCNNWSDWSEIAFAHCVQTKSCTTD